MPARRLTAAGGEALDEIVAEEVAVALVYNGISHAVMMATPCDLEDFARGFSLTERIVDKPSEIYDIEVEPVERGIEVRLDIAAQRMARPAGAAAQPGRPHRLRPVRRRQHRRGDAAGDRRRAPRRRCRAGPSSGRWRPCRSSSASIALNGATHAAGWARPDGTLVAVREDVGRHNALDKLGGALARSGALQPGGFVVVTSRCSYEMVHKAAALGAAAIAAVSAPTSLAIETAEQAGIALAAFVRDGRLTVYANADRISA